MFDSRQWVLIRKDVAEVTGNRRLFSVMWIVPLIFVVVLPAMMFLIFAFGPEADLSQLGGMSEILHLAPGESLPRLAARLAVDYIFPSFFLMIPIMAASVMAASSFVGEKERRTLETLLYSPLTVQQVFVAKVIAAFLVSQIVSTVSFIIFSLVTVGTTAVVMGGAIGPGLTWAPLMLLASPAIGLLGVITTVGVSAKSKSTEEAQQYSAYLVLPLALLAVTQFTGLFLLRGWMMLALGAAVLLLDAFLLSRAAKRYTAEAVLL